MSHCNFKFTVLKSKLFIFICICPRVNCIFFFINIYFSPKKESFILPIQKTVRTLRLGTETVSLLRFLCTHRQSFPWNKLSDLVEFWTGSKITFLALGRNKKCILKCNITNMTEKISVYWLTVRNLCVCSLHQICHTTGKENITRCCKISTDWLLFSCQNR